MASAAAEQTLPASEQRRKKRTINRTIVLAADLFMLRGVFFSFLYFAVGWDFLKGKRLWRKNVIFVLLQLAALITRARSKKFHFGQGVGVVDDGGSMLRVLGLLSAMGILGAVGWVGGRGGGGWIFNTESLTPRQRRSGDGVAGTKLEKICVYQPPPPQNQRFKGRL